MERPIKGGYILISLGLIALSGEYAGSIDYERITKTKKHIVLTGIKVGSEIKPDVVVQPVFGVGTVIFKNVYGYDIAVHSNNSVDVSESEEIPNVEEAPSGTLDKMLGLNSSGKVVKGDLIPNVKEAESGTPVSMLGLDEDGEVVKSAIPSGGGTKLYVHTFEHSQSHSTFKVISPISSKLSEYHFTTNYPDVFYGSGICCYESTYDGVGNIITEIILATFSLGGGGSSLSFTGVSHTLSNYSESVTEL